MATTTTSPPTVFADYTTPEQEDATDGAALYLRERDETPYVQADLPDELAVALLIARGWVLEPCRGGNAYVKPGKVRRGEGEHFGDDYLWDRGEALRLELATIALETVRGEVAR